MSNPREKYAVDRVAEAQGDVVRVDDMEFIVRSASASNRKYRYALALAHDKRRAEAEGLPRGNLRAFELLDSSMIEAFADAVILGWNNVDGDDGKPLEFNRANCVQLMEDCPLIWDAVREAALDAERFKPLAREDGGELGKP